MFNLVISQPNRPNKVTDIKNLDYHVQMARYCIGAVSRQKHQAYLQKLLINWSFYKGIQWIFEEDLDSFLKDESGEARNRIRQKENIIRPMIKMYVANAILVEFNYKVEAINENAVTRRNKELTKLLNMQAVADVLPEEQAALLKNNFPIGESPGETEEMFDKEFVDAYVRAINYLCKFIHKQNKIDDLKPRLAEHLAVGGLCVSREYELHGQQRWTVVLPQTVFWDTNAQKPTLTDGEYAGHMDMVMPVTLYERKPDMPPDDKQAIEQYVAQKKFSDFNFLTKVTGNFNIEGRVPLARVEWQDIERQQWGYISEYGVEVFMRVNYKNGKYKTKDLIWPSDPDKKKELNSNKMMVRYPTVTRFVEFVPKEYLGRSNKNDIVIEWGVIPHSEQNYMCPDPNPFTYKFSTYEYFAGEVSAPIDDIIDPQRLINRINSVAEAKINNSGGAGSVFDLDMLDEEGEEGLLRRTNTNKPVVLKNTGGNLQNAIGKYDFSNVNSAEAMLALKELIANTARNNIGINEAMTGTNGGKRELNGVTESMLKQGSLMQETFYYALNLEMSQIAESMANRGKNIFIDNDTWIYYAVGDRYTKALKLTQDYYNEYFRAFTERVSPESDQKTIANTFAIQMLQLGLLDKVRFAAVFNNGTVDDVRKLVQASVNEQDYAEKQNSQMQMQMAQQQDQQMQQQQQAKTNVPIEVARTNQQGNLAKEIVKQNAQT